MGLKIKSIDLVDFRNHQRFSLEGIGDLTIFVGRNGVGKTNVLEGINLLTAASTFRHAQVSHLIREGASFARASMRCEGENRQLDVSLQLEPGKKRFSVNGKAKPASEVRGVLPSIAFTPDDLEIAKKSSSLKRQALDDLGSQLNGNYSILSRDFEKTLRYKNRLLKDEESQLMVDAINETLITCAVQLFCYRHALYRKMIPYVSDFYQSIARSGEQFSVVYQPSWDYLTGEGENSSSLLDESLYSDRNAVRETMSAALNRHAPVERARHRSLVGPHNDKIYFMLNGRDASQFASQGQQRSIVLAWKLAEVEMVRQTLGIEPVLLLDDVMSELDGSRRDMLVGNVTETTQTFVTATDLSPFNPDLLKRARVVELV